MYLCKRAVSWCPSTWQLSFWGARNLFFLLSAAWRKVCETRQKGGIERRKFLIVQLCVKNHLLMRAELLWCLKYLSAKFQNRVSLGRRAKDHIYLIYTWPASTSWIDGAEIHWLILDGLGGLWGSVRDDCGFTTSLTVLFVGLSMASIGSLLYRIQKYHLKVHFDTNFNSGRNVKMHRCDLVSLRNRWCSRSTELFRNLCKCQVVNIKNVWCYRCSSDRSNCWQRCLKVNLWNLHHLPVSLLLIGGSQVAKSDQIIVLPVSQLQPQRS